MDTMTSNGVYLCAKPKNEHAKIIYDFCAANGVDNHLQPHELHTTLIHCSKISTSRSITSDAPLYVADVHELDIWNVNGSNILVMRLNSDDLKNRHYDIRESHGLTHDYSDYIPHMSLSYSVQQNIDLDKLNFSLKKYIDAIHFTTEHQSEIVEDYGRN